MRRQVFRRACLAVAAFAAAFGVNPAAFFAQSSPAAPSVAKPVARTAEARAARAYDAAVHTGPLALHSFLAEFPKGADLHFHLWAGVYAAIQMRVAGEDKLCIDPAQAKFARNEAGETV